MIPEMVDRAIDEYIKSEIKKALELAKEVAVKQYRESNDDWEKRFKQVENFLSRLTFDDKTRKAWLVAGDYQMLQFYLNEIRKKSSGLNDEKNSRV